jgi:hypothetical protein
MTSLRERSDWLRLLLRIAKYVKEAIGSASPYGFHYAKKRSALEIPNFFGVRRTEIKKLNLKLSFYIFPNLSVLVLF